MSAPAPVAPTAGGIEIDTQVQQGPPFNIVVSVSNPGMPVPNHNFQITLTPSGVVDSRYPNGVIPPLPPSLSWASIPGVPNAPQGTPTSLALSSYLTAVGGSPVYSIVGALPPGWSLNTSTGLLSYSGTGLGSASVQAKATIGSVTATSQAFSLQTFNPIGGDTTAPTIPTGLSLGTGAGGSNVLTWDASSDPVVPNQAQSGMKQYVITRDANTSFATVASAAGLTNQFAYNDIGAVGAAGSAVQAANGVDWSVTAAGSDIFNSPDAFGFLSSQVNAQATGVVNLIARLNSFTGTLANAKAGLMIRQSLAPDAPFAMITYQAGGVADSLALHSRATSGGATATIGLAAPAGPLWLKLSLNPSTNTITVYYSSAGLTWTPLGSVVVPMPPAVFVGLALCSLSTSSLATAAFAQLNLQNLPSLTYTDSGGGSHSYSVLSQDNAGTPNSSASSPIVQSLSLMGEMQQAITNRKVYVFQTLDSFSTTPMDAVNKTANASPATATVIVNTVPPTDTHLIPAGYDFFLNNVGNDEQSNPPPNDDISLGIATLKAGGMARFNYEPPNPHDNTYSNHVFDPNCLVPGTATYNNFFAQLQADGAKLAQICAAGPVWVSIMGEMNLSGYWADIASGCTEAQFAAVWQMVVTIFKTFTKKFNTIYEPNDGVNNYTWGYPGNAWVDCVGLHSFADGALGTNDTTAYNALMAISGNKPFWLGSTGLKFDLQNLPAFSGNNWTQVCQVAIATFPNLCALVFWFQTDSLANQNGAVQSMSDPMLNRSNVTAVNFAGGNQGG